MSTQEEEQIPRDSSFPSLPQLTSTDVSEGSLGATFAGSVGAATSNAANHEAIAEMERRVSEKASSIQSQASELQELEARLQAAERKKQELEARGVRI